MNLDLSVFEALQVKNQITQMTKTSSMQAVRNERPAQEVDQQQYLTFSLGSEMFAIGILKIREIIEFDHLTEVPMAPPFIKGVINLRGAVVPVIDLSVRFGRSARDVTKRTCIVIIETAIDDQLPRQQMGVIVDAVSEVLEIPADEIELPPAFGTKLRGDFISGMGKVNGKFVVILDVSQILSIEEIAVVSGLERVDESTHQ